MKKVLVILALIAVTGIAIADLIVDDVIPTNSYMNVFMAADGGWAWGNDWGGNISGLRVNSVGGNLALQTNVDPSDENPTDPYWAPGNLTMEASNYKEYWGYEGQNVAFNFEVLSNNLAGTGLATNLTPNGYVTEAFIKMLDPGAGWATVQQLYQPLTVGTHSINLDINNTAGVVVQLGFRVMGANDVTGSATADLAAVIVPEPATMVLLGLGGLLLRRKK